jgi:hypothetical protein
MAIRARGPSIAVGGWVVFLVGDYGVAGPDVSSLLAAAGFLTFLAGLIIVLSGLNGATRSPPNPYVLGVAALASALNVYEQIRHSSDNEFSAGWLLWGLTPYLVCIAASCLPAIRVPAVAGVLVALALDSYAYYDVFLSGPTGAQSPLGLLFTPLLNTIVFAPLAMLVAWLIIRRCNTSGTNAP